NIFSYFFKLHYFILHLYDCTSLARYNVIKRKGLDYITDGPSKLIKLTEIATNMKSISRERIRNRPKLPKSISEVHEYINNTKPKQKDEYFIITNDPLDQGSATFLVSRAKK
ncbi:Uncharacterized protein FWK35_00027287, partial [Aphis craccivora]